MKLLKNNLIKKLIIILIVLMIFNIAVPNEVKAWDFAVILFKPISSMILGILVTIDTSIGVFLNGPSIAVDVVGSIVELITGSEEDALDTMSGALNKLFIGPDTIFSGGVKMLNANIFDTVDLTQISDITISAGNSLSVTETVNDLSNAVSPGNKMIVKIREAIASTYTAIRDICGFIMLAGLIFTGIRILISSNMPNKKTRWLEMLEGWIIGMVLLIFSHVIMVGIFTLSDMLTHALGSSLYRIWRTKFYPYKTMFIKF